jgi:uncharacterized protein (TIGR03085 family)
MRLVQAERQALCDTMLEVGREVGPEAPTLCGGWTLLDLAAHVAVRDRRPDAAVGLVVPALHGRLERVMAERASLGLPAVVDQIRSGPPAWSPARLPGVDTAVNLAELVVHHEDVRRANGMGPRTDVPELAEEVWRTLPISSTAPLASNRVPVVVVHADGRRRVLRRGDNPVVLTGEPIELLLHLFGRREHAQVEVGGPSLSVTRFEGSSGRV